MIPLCLLPRPNSVQSHLATTTSSHCSRPRQCRAAFLEPGRVRLTSSSTGFDAHRYMYCSGYLRSGCRRSTADAIYYSPRFSLYYQTASQYSMNPQYIAFSSSSRLSAAQIPKLCHLNDPISYQGLHSQTMNHLLHDEKRTTVNILQGALSTSIRNVSRLLNAL